MAQEFITPESPKIDVVVRSRSKTYFDGQASVITSTNETGIFDILPQHANFITMIQDFVNVVLPDGKEQKFEIKRGVLRVLGNKADIYLTV
jgi:F0F1-type ATP synthase epsilon subunit